MRLDGLQVGRPLRRMPTWGTVEQAGARSHGITAGPVSAAARPIVEIQVDTARTRPTGVDELDRVLGGGLIPGSRRAAGG